MPIQPTYPGVYIEELPSGVRSITGVATSVTAFIGRALRGPTDQAVVINSFGDFERQFGGLWADSMMSYAVRDFYQNGGSKAVIVRVAKNAETATITLPTMEDGTGVPLTLQAKSPGQWGERLRVSVNYNTREAKDNHPRETDFFNLTIQEAGGATETFSNVSVNAKDARYVVRVLNETSALVNVATPLPIIRPLETLTSTIELAAGSQKLVLEVLPQARPGRLLTASVNVTGVGSPKLFNLEITYGAYKEEYKDVSIDPDAKANFVENKLKSSKLVRVKGKVPTDRPNAIASVKRTFSKSNNLARTPDSRPIKLPAGNKKLTLAFTDSLTDKLVVLAKQASVLVDYNGVANNQHFNLIITFSDETPEPFSGLSIDSADGDDYVKTKLRESSKLLNVQGDVPDSRPDSTPQAIASLISSDGTVPTPTEYIGSENDKTGLYALLKADFNLLCIPPAERDNDTAPEVYQAALNRLLVKKRAMLLVDPHLDWGTSSSTAIGQAETILNDLGLAGSNARNAALYFPRVLQADPLYEGQTQTFVPCGMVAGIMARIDSSRGVWKSPAGLDASLNGIQGLQLNLSDDEQGSLNSLGINCLRQFPVAGRVVWGARTLRGADQLADTDNKYVAVRRMSLFLEESLYRGTQWVVFEPNDEPLWAQIRLNIGAFMQNLFRQGAFQGKTPREAYLVKCDSETTTQTDINQGVVNILVGFAPLKPAEFVFIKLQQLAGQIAV